MSLLVDTTNITTLAMMRKVITPVNTLARVRCECLRIIEYSHECLLSSGTGLGTGWRGSCTSP